MESIRTMLLGIALILSGILFGIAETYLWVIGIIGLIITVIGYFNKDNTNQG